MKFGVREICDVTFKTTAAGQKVGNTVFDRAGMPAFFIDTAKTSSLEQATTTVYAQGGKGYNRLIAWEGEKTMTFTVEDALISPMGLAVLSGAGLIKAGKDSKKVHVHITVDAAVNAEGKAIVYYADLQEETGMTKDNTVFHVCCNENIPVYGTVIDGSGAGVEFIPTAISVEGGAGLETLPIAADEYVTFNVGTAYANRIIKLDFYLAMSEGVTNIEIKPSDFGGFFYVEAQTLFRREDTGLDMAAEIILPKVKVQSGFTFSMAASGDPSTFTFTMDAFPGYTMFDRTKKVMCVMQVIGEDESTSDNNTDHEHSFVIKGAVSKLETAPNDINKELSQANQDNINVSKVNDNTYKVKTIGALAEFASTDSTQGTKDWIGLVVDTGLDDITKVKYNGTFLSSDDVKEADGLGLPKGSFILWTGYCDLKPKTFTLSTNSESKTITIKKA